MRSEQRRRGSCVVRCSGMIGKPKKSSTAPSEAVHRAVRGRELRLLDPVRFVVVEDVGRPPGGAGGVVEVNSAAASHDILDRGRCNCNAAEPRSELHTPHTAARFARIRSSLALIRAA